MQKRRQTWMLGGIGLIVSGAFGMLGSSLLGLPGTDLVAVLSDATYAAAVILFAIGLSAEASVVARRALGMTALVVLAVWPLVSSALWTTVGALQPGGDDAWMALGYVSLLVPIAAGIIAAVQIARAAVVPAPWQWAPLWVLVVQVTIGVLPQLVGAAAGAQGIQSFIGVFTLLGTVSYLLGTIGLGTVAVVLADSQRPETVDVYRSGGAA